MLFIISDKEVFTSVYFVCGWLRCLVCLFESKITKQTAGRITTEFGGRIRFESGKSPSRIVYTLLYLVILVSIGSSENSSWSLMKEIKNQACECVRGLLSFVNELNAWCCCHIDDVDYIKSMKTPTHTHAHAHPPARTHSLPCKQTEAALM